MTMAQVIIPPNIGAEQDVVQFEWVDDQTVAHVPQFGRKWTQRVSFGDPRLRLRLNFRAMLEADRTRLMSQLQEARGRAIVVRVGPYQRTQGSLYETCPEMGTNSDFTNGTTGWSTASCTIAVSNRVLRVKSYQTGGTGDPFWCGWIS